MADYTVTVSGGGISGGSGSLTVGYGIVLSKPLPAFSIDADVWYPGLSGNPALPKPHTAGVVWNAGIGGSYRLPALLTTTGNMVVTLNLGGTLRLRPFRVSGSFGFDASLALPKPSTSGEIMRGIGIPATLRLQRLSTSGEISNPLLISSAIRVTKLHAYGDINAGRLLNASFHTPDFRLIGNIIAGNPLAADISLTAVLVAGEVVQGILFDLDAILPGFTVEGGLSLGNGYSVLVINIENLARTEYEDFPFNSMISFNGKAYGASDDGIYLLDGVDDNGAYIKAFVTTGLSDLGASLKKNVPDVYMGYCSDGQIGIRSVTDNMVEGSEQIREKAITGIGKTRIMMPRGRLSRYWGYKIRNIAGASLEIDTIEPAQDIGVRRV